ncbi:MAG: hypothetical protein KF799_15180 [Bdellovibrionales bacterium]|nr:hypothetical protein [Bdellovibrionales bacterium]
MMKSLVLVLAVAGLAGCASTGSSGVAGAANQSGGNSVTQFSSPKPISADEFKQDPKKYAKSWTNYKGGGVDSFKKVTIPSYTLEFQTGVYQVNRNKMAALLGNSDGARSTLTMSVGFPWEVHQEMLKEVAATSAKRLKEKFQKAGVEVVEWETVKAGNEKAADFEKNRLANEPVLVNDHLVSIAAPGMARLKSGIWAFAASSLSRNAEVSLIFPNFGIGFGYFGGETTPHTITEGHDMTSVKFTPQAQVLTGSGFDYQSKWNTGNISLDYTAVSNDPFVKKMVKGGDSRAAAKESGEARRGLAMAMSGAQSHEVKVSTSAAVEYKLDIDPAKYKELILSQLDAAENLIVERYKNEF